MKICVSFFDSMYAISAEKVEYLPWDELSRYLTDVVPTEIPKTKLPCLVFGRITEGARRRNESVETVDALVLDIEQPKTGALSKKPVYLRRLDEALAALEPFEYALYSTYSHTENDPRFRVVIPLRTPILPADYKSAMSAINNLTGYISDQNAQRLSQPVFAPYCPTLGAHESATYINNGKFYDFHGKLAQEIVEIRSLLGEGVGRAPADAEKRAACRSVLQGVPYARSGNRDNMALAITWHLAKHYRQEALPSREAFEAVFKWSLQEMALDSSDAPTMADLWSKFERGVARTATGEIDSATTSDKAPENLVLCFRTATYIKTRDGGYTRSLDRCELPMAISNNLSGVVPLQYVAVNGDTREITAARILKDHGKMLEGVAIDLSARQSYYHDRVIYEKTLRWPTLQPQFDPLIDEWLNLLGQRRAEQLKDWLSIFHDLNRLLSCLIIMGEPGAGKTLLAMGLASRLGADSPASQKTLTGDFQGELVKCPLIHIDEEIVESSYSRSFLASIRSELSVTERFVNRKYAPPATLKGAIRCVITANHLPFKQKDASTRQDLEAIAQRFHWVTASREAASFLEKIQPDTKQHWRREGIARHMVHLEQTRSVSHEHRFGVPGESEKLADLINISVEWNAWVTEWICAGAIDGFHKLNTDPETKHGAFIKDSKIYVRANAIVKKWSCYLPDIGVKPNTRPITEALKGVSAGIAKPSTIGVELNNQFRFYEIRSSPLYAWLEETGMGSVEEFSHALSKPTKFASNVVSFRGLS